MTAQWTIAEPASGAPAAAAPTALEGHLRLADWRAHRHATWIPSRHGPGRPVWARVDAPPDGLARGALVIVPSVGREAVVSYRTVSAVAVQAARAGFVAITFSFTGDGDSAPLQPQEDLTGRWQEDLAAVIDLARDLVGDDRLVHALGLRLGASVLAAAPESSSAEGTIGHSASERRIFWEPVSGRSYLLAHRLVRSRTVPVAAVPTTQGTELDGMLLSPAHVASLSRLTVPRRDRPGVRIERDRAVAARLALGAPYYATVPQEAIAQIVAGLPGGEAAPLRAWTPQLTTRIDTPAGEVVETLCVVGPDRLPAIRTTSLEAPARVGLLGTAMGSEIKAGPGNLWATAARELAPSGVVTLRVDRRQLGDDADPDAIEEPRPYRDEAVQDVAAAARALAAEGLPVVGIGLCAGAWALLRAAGADAPLRHVIGVNLAHWNPDARVYTEQFYAHYHREAALEGVPAEGDDHPGGEEAGDDFRPRPSFAQWRAHVVEALRTEVAIRFPRLRSALQPDVPLDLVDPMIRALPRTCGASVLLGLHDHRIFVGKGGARAVGRARRRGREIEVLIDPRVDHSLFAELGRAATLDLLRRRLLSIADAEQPASTSPARAEVPSPVLPRDLSCEVVDRRDAAVHA